MRAIPGLWQGQFDPGGAHNIRFGPDVFLGGVFGFDNRAARSPAALDVETDLHPKPIGLAQGMFIKFAPSRCEKSRTMRHRAVSFLAGSGGDVEDAPITMFDHSGRHRAGRVERTRKIHAQHPVNIRPCCQSNAQPLGWPEGGYEARGGMRDFPADVANNPHFWSHPLIGK